MSITESESHYDHLERMPASQLLQHINQEDQKVALAVAQVLPAITTFVERREAPDSISDADTDLMLPADLVESYQQAQEALPGSADG